jgi:hypothetical protein
MCALCGQLHFFSPSVWARCFSGRVRRPHYVLLGVEAAPWGWFLGIGFGSGGLGAVIGIVFVLLFLSCSLFKGLWKAATIFFCTTGRGLEDPGFSLH